MTPITHIMPMSANMLSSAGGTDARRGVERFDQDAQPRDEPFGPSAAQIPQESSSVAWSMTAPVGHDAGSGPATSSTPWRRAD